MLAIFYNFAALGCGKVAEIASIPIDSCILRGVFIPTRHDGFVKVALAGPFVSLVQTNGGDPSVSFDAFGLTADDFSNQNKPVHAEIIYGFTNHLTASTGNPCLGFQVAETLDLTRWPPVQDAFATAKTVAEFYAIYLSNVPHNASSVRHALHIDADRTEYSVRRTVHTAHKPIQVEAFGIGLHIRLLQHLVGGSWSPKDVELETSYASAIPNDLTDVPVVHGDVEGLQLRFPSQWLTLKLDASQPKPDNGSAPKATEITIVEALRGASIPLLQDRTRPTADFARALGLPENRLAKALRLQGTTLPRELKRLHIDVAKDKLASTKMTVAEIAELLGYDDQSHFARFFRSPTGASPTGFRKSA